MTPLAAASPSDPVGIAEALVGLPVATVVVSVVLVLGIALHRRIIVLGRELEALEESFDRETAAAAETLDEIRTERDWWRDTAVRALDLGERAVASRGEAP